MLDSVACIFYYSEAIEFTDIINHNFSLRNFAWLIDVNCVAIAYILYKIHYEFYVATNLQRKKIFY